jgi:hypothetical protein
MPLAVCGRFRREALRWKPPQGSGTHGLLSPESNYFTFNGLAE